MSIVPAQMVGMLSKNSPLYDWKEHFKIFAKFYEDDLPNPLALEAEMQLWEKYWLNYKGCRPDSIAPTLKAVNFKAFENIKVALRLLATLPVTSCECERTFSGLRRLKNYNRSTMVEDRFSGLALMYIHTEINPSIDQIIEQFASVNRRLELI